MFNGLLLAQIFCCFSLTGLIWVIQILHYPGFHFVDILFKDFHSFHSTRISMIVIPLMLTELATASLLALQNPSRFGWNFVGVLLIWASTFFLSVPLHNQLAGERNSQLIAQLVLTNWPRTLLWSLRSGFWLYFLSKTLPPST
jgi:hypothetical protein